MRFYIVKFEITRQWRCVRLGGDIEEKEVGRCIVRSKGELTKAKITNYIKRNSTDRMQLRYVETLGWDYSERQAMNSIQNGNKPFNK